MTVILSVPKESLAGEKRVALSPSVVSKFIGLGIQIHMQRDAGLGIYAADPAYKGVAILSSTKELYDQSAIVLRIQPPTEAEVNEMKEGSILISFLYPHLNKGTVQKLCQKKIASFAMELIPRISRAQSMDVLSSQATIAGYKAVLLAANESQFFFPMLTTAAGSIRPAKVLIIGAGVAGLQAIATARRLGAIVEAYDVRPDAKGQIESLGGKAIQTGIQATGTGGYARELTAEEKQQQREVLKKHVSQSNVIITTAGVPGKPAPKIIFKDMIEAMQPGSVIIDIMAEMGGNCELVKAGETVEHQQVKLIGTKNIYSSLATHASEMFAKNAFNFIELMVKEGQLQVPWEDAIIQGCIVTRDGQIVNEQVKKLLEK